MGTRRVSRAGGVLSALAFLLTAAICPAQTWQTWPYFPPPQGGPLQAANMLAAVLAADVVATSNITLSGIQTIDGMTLQQGQVVLAQAQTTSSTKGLWVVQSGSWTRPINFPSGYAISQNCELLILIKSGTVNSGTHWFVDTSSGVITIDTTSFTVTQVPISATPSRAGVVNITGGVLAAGVANAGVVANNCVSFTNSAGTIGNVGDANAVKGPCAVEDANTTHLVLQNGGGPPTSSAGTLNSNSSDHWGRVTGLTAATSVVITFSVAFPNSVVSCVGSDSAGTAVGVNYTVSGSTVTAATFSMTALTGSLSYVCFGTN